MKIELYALATSADNAISEAFAQLARANHTDVQQRPLRKTGMPEVDAVLEKYKEKLFCVSLTVWDDRVFLDKEAKDETQA